MNGHFEADNTQYPITNMPSGERGFYHIMDMRSLHKLDERAVPVHVAKPIVQKLNIMLQNNKFSGQHADALKLKVKELLDEALKGE